MSSAPVVAGTRIGITKAVELRWRFCAAGNPHVSRPWPEAVGIARRGISLGREEGAAAERRTAATRLD